MIEDPNDSEKEEKAMYIAYIETSNTTVITGYDTFQQAWEAANEACEQLDHVILAEIMEGMAQKVIASARIVR